MIFRGEAKASIQLGNTLREAANICLKLSAEKIYHKYNQAPITIDANAAQKIMQFDDLRNLPPVLKFFDVVKPDGSIDINILAIQSIKDYLQSEGQVDGRKLLDNFLFTPYGWNRDTTRYLISAMFIASEIKLRIAGDWVKVKGPSSIEKLSSNSNFNQIGISLYTEGQPTQMQILAAQKNLAELTGETVPPLPQRISELVIKHFPRLQSKYADLPLRLENLNLPGEDKAIAIREGIEEILKGDASDATFRLGKKDADLYMSMKWASNIYKSIENGIEKTIKEIQSLRKGIAEFPDEGVIADLKKQLKSRFEELDKILSSDNFFEKAPDLNDHLMEIKNAIAYNCEQFRNQENEKIEKEISKIKASYEWKRLSEEQKSELSARLQESIIQEKEGINGIREIINEIFSFRNFLDTINYEIEEYLKVSEIIKGTKKRIQVSLKHLPRSIENKEDFDIIINELKKVKDSFIEDEIIDLNW
jgi:hypothetical protein